MSVGSGPAIGAELGGYRLEALVGRGGMSAVYRAEDLRLGRRVALKFLAPELAQDARFRERFLGESRLAASIDHAGIVPIFEAGEVDGLLYIAMRYVEGTDLRALLRRDGPLAADRAVALVAQLAAALDAAHARGLVHRDVKPSNALVAVESGVEHVYLADFGLTKHATSRGGPTASGQMVGTVDYVAPEQIRGDEVDGRADLYSLGCVLFECLTGEVPFPRGSEVATIYAHLEADPPRASARRAGVPAALDAVVTRALLKDPARRWPSGNELAGAARAALPPNARPRRRPRSPRPAVLAAVGLIGLIAAVVGAIVLTRSGGGGTTLAPIDANAVAVIDPGHASLIAQIPSGASPSQIASGARAVWVTNTDANTVSRIDPKTHTVSQTIPVGSGPGAIAVGDGAVWVVNSLSGTLSWIDPSTNPPQVVKTIPLGNGPSGVCVGGGAVWVANSDDRTIWRIDPHTGHRTKTIVLDTAPTQLACGGGAVWASSESAGKVTEIDPRSGVLQEIPVGNGASGIAYGAGAVWVANTLDGTISRIDPRLGVATTFLIGAGEGPASVAADARNVWVSNEFGGTVARIDPKRGTVLKRLQIGRRPQGIALIHGALWVGVGASGANHRGGTLRILSQLAFTPKDFDLATSDAPLTFQLAGITNDGLTAFRRVGGHPGLTLVPDLAASLPAPTDGGRTYRFRLRSGIHYSTGALVRPADIRRELERSFDGGRDSLGSNFFGAIAGAPACAERPAACDLSRGIAVDDATGTITFHLTSPDADFLNKLALPWAVAVPASSPAVPQRRPPPATGPYVIARLQPPRLVRLVRNPHFHVWSTAAKPDGYVDDITIRFGVKESSAIRAVEGGQADYAFGVIQHEPRTEIDALYTRFAGQVHTNPSPVLISAFLNTRVAPFDNIDARRALNYAVDRRALVSIERGVPAQPTCQILPPDFPGYRPYCPYTANPGPGRPWSAPDLAKAQRLIARSHTRGMRVSVWAPRPDLAPYARFVVALLGELGYRASLRLVAAEKYFPFVDDSRHHAQIGVASWGADYPAARDFLQVQYSCSSFARNDPRNVDWSEFCDARADRLMEHAERLQSTDARSASAVWASAERRIVDEAPLLPLANPKQVDVVSRRVGNYQYNPQWGVLLDQLWVR